VDVTAQAQQQFPVFTSTHLSSARARRWRVRLKSSFRRRGSWWTRVLRNSGRLLLYASAGGSQRKRLDSVREAARETAQRLNLGFDVVPFRKRCSQIYVYYENGNDEPVPIYCDEGKTFDPEGICASLRRMMFVLSFHPRNGALRTMRTELMGFS